MKVNSINSNNYGCNAERGAKRRIENNSLKEAPAFKGAFSVSFWDAIARGGLAASFTIQDMTGTNIPRTIQALNRNKDMTGKNNYKAASEVAVREFLTGPSMFIIPMSILGFVKKVSGTANEIPMENIAPFADQMKTILHNTKVPTSSSKLVRLSNAQLAEMTKTNFYERMFALALGENLQNGTVPSENAKKLAQMLKKYDMAPKRGIFKQMFKKDIVLNKNNGSSLPMGAKIEAKDQIMDKIVSEFCNMKKLLTDDYTTLMTTDLGGNLNKPNNIEDLVVEFSDFANDVKKVIMKHASKSGATPTCGLNFNSFMDTFKAKRTGSRFLTNLTMVVATALFLIKIPKLYSMHKTNPETDAFREQESEVKNANQ